MALQQALQQQREHEQQVKQAALGNADNIEFGSGIVKLYKAEGKKMNWVEQGVGMLVWWSSKFGDEQRFRCLRISDMHPILDEELYDNFDENYTCTKTKRGTHFFHTMEFEHDVWGVCFAREADASNFAQKIKIMAPKGDPKGGGKKDKKKEKEKKEGGGGWFGGGKKKEKERESSREEEPAMQIGMPTNFKHVTHIGWDEANGFEVANLPDEWKSLFKAAGVKKKDLQNKDTARVIVDTLASNMTEDQLANMPALPGVTDRPRPPPPPGPRPPPGPPPGPRPPPGAPPGWSGVISRGPAPPARPPPPPPSHPMGSHWRR